MKVWLEYRQHVNASIDDFFHRLWNRGIELLFGFGQTLLFLYQCVRLSFAKPSRFSLMVRHMHFIGNESVIIIALTGCFTGLALSYQIYIGFNLVNATNLVGPTVALGIFKELAPVLTVLIVAARAGGAMDEHGMNVRPDIVLIQRVTDRQRVLGQRQRVLINLRSI